MLVYRTAGQIVGQTLFLCGSNFCSKDKRGPSLFKVPIGRADHEADRFSIGRARQR